MISRNVAYYVMNKLQIMQIWDKLNIHKQARISTFKQLMYVDSIIRTTAKLKKTAVFYVSNGAYFKCPSFRILWNMGSL